MPRANVTTKGQVTIPREVRDFLHIKEGDVLEFVPQQNGQVRLARVASSALGLFGVLRRSGRRAPTVEEMDAALGKFLAGEDRRVRAQPRRGRKPAER